MSKTKENMDSSIIEFDYTKEALEDIAKEANGIDTSSIEDVKTMLKVLVRVRTTISKQGKSFRDTANAYNKSVLEKEKEYLGIVAPVESEMKQILDDEKEREIKKERELLLPEKKKQLEVIKYKCKELSDDDILNMSDEEWNEYLGSQLDFNIQENQRKIDVENREKEIRQEEKDKAKRKAEKIKEDEILEKERKEKEFIEEQERLAKEEAEEKANLEEDRTYQKFLDHHKFNEKTDIIQHEGLKVKLYRLVADIEL